MSAEQRLTETEAAALPVLLRTVVGSEVHGTGLPEGGDIDNMAIAVEPMEMVLGVEQSPAQWSYRTAHAREKGGQSARSFEGDLDYTIYPARKWVALASAGNPSVLAPLFVQEHHVISADEAGEELRANRDRFVSKTLAAKHYGYMVSQRDRMAGKDPVEERYGRRFAEHLPAWVRRIAPKTFPPRERPTNNRRVNRPELIEAFGYDTKFAGHYLRLGHQGLGVLRDGTLHVPLDAVTAESILAVRRGERSLEDVLAEGASLEKQMRALLQKTKLRPYGDTVWANDWLARTQLAAWKVPV